MQTCACAIVCLCTVARSRARARGHAAAAQTVSAFVAPPMAAEVVNVQGLNAHKDVEEEDALSSSSCAAGGVTASTASGSGGLESGHDAAEVSHPLETAEALHARTPTAQKHPLQCTWCLWVLLHSHSAKDNWQHSQTNVASFDSVEEFWRLFNNIKRPSRLGVVDLSIFKKDVWPAWEDETCRHGGRWIAKVDKMRPQDFDELWLTLILTVIGEEMSDAGQCICGAVFSCRTKSSKMAVWISERQKEKALPVGHAFRKVLQDAGHSGSLAFEGFDKTEKVAFSI